MALAWISNKGQIFQVAAAVYALCQAGYSRATDANTPTWQTIALVGIAVAVVVGVLIDWLHRRKIDNPLRLVDSEFVPDPRVTTEYKKKLYLTFRNDSDQTITVGPKTVWLEGDLHVRPIDVHVWRLEGSRGVRNGDWSDESEVVHVPPGRRIKTWVGLPNDSVRDVVMHAVSDQRAGSLSVPVAVRTKVLKIKI